MRLRYESGQLHHREKRREPQLDEQAVAQVRADLAREREERRLAEDKEGWSPRENVEPDELLDAESAPKYAGMAHLNTYTEKARAWFTGKRAQGKRVEQRNRANVRDTVRGGADKLAETTGAEITPIAKHSEDRIKNKAA